MNYRAELLIEANKDQYPHFGSGEGNGIVYVGGGKYWPMIVAGIRLLRDTGCTLPVEVWYRGKCEEVFHEDVMGLNVRLCDVDATASVFQDWRLPTGLTCKGGWEAKLYAIYHTNFDSILFLDADAYCVENPEPLFDLVKDNSFVYWRDLLRQDNAIKWENVFPAAEPWKVPPVQGGQMLINRTRAQKLISVCNWMCQHSEYFFKQMYGDQDTWRVGLAMGLSDGWCIENAKWNRIAFQCDYQDKTYILHRCGGKLFEPKNIPANDRKASNPVYDLPKEVELFNHFSDVVNKRDPESAEVFKEIYERRIWGTANLSGIGSTMAHAEPFVDECNRLVRLHNIRSIIDAGCGTGLIGSKLNVETYIGVDCYPDLIESNKKKYPNNSYLALDILTDYDIIPVVDCFVCRDVLHHWPNVMVRQLLDKLIQSKKFKYVIICQDNHQRSETADCYLGGYRALSFKMKPLSEYAFDSVKGIGYKTIALMRVR
jgi:SAM-dependent methyltransferase